MTELDMELTSHLEEADKALRLWLQEPANPHLKEEYKQKREELIQPLFNMSEALKNYTKDR